MEREHLEVLGVDGRIILKWIFSKDWGGGMDWIALAHDTDRWWVLVNVVMNLIYICLCIVIPNYSQQDATFLDLFISTDALHVSGGFSAHHQEHTTVHTASGIVNQYCC